mgnify:CR=1 FL=1
MTTGRSTKSRTRSKGGRADCPFTARVRVYPLQTETTSDRISLGKRSGKRRNGGKSPHNALLELKKERQAVNMTVGTNPRGEETRAPASVRAADLQISEAHVLTQIRLSLLLWLIAN